MHPKLFRVATAMAFAATAANCSNSPRKAAPPAPQSATPPNPSSRGVVSGQVPWANPGTIVVLEPRGSEPLPPQAAPPTMDQIQLTFVPDILIARAGFPVLFHSSDDQLHNINVQVMGKRFAEFNRSIPPGGTFEHVFKDPGFYDVRCDIHPAMTAEIFVSASPYAQTAGSDGGFTFENIPPGHYTLIVHNGGVTKEKEVDVTTGANRVRFDGG